MLRQLSYRKAAQVCTSFQNVPSSNNGVLTDGKRAPSLPFSDVNPPDIQKVVVEHIVRSRDVVPHIQAQVRLRSFSGKIPIPNHEAEYEAWCTHIELLQNDPSMSPLQTSRKILESLLPPAADVVKGLRPESKPAA